MITESEKDIFELEQIYNIMIHDMADQLTTDYHGQSWIINYYFQKAKQKLKGGNSYDEETSKDDKKIKLNPEINVDIPEVKLRNDYVDAAARMAENLKNFNEKTTTSFKNAAEAMSNFGAKAADLIKNGALKDNCTHCGRKINLTLLDTHYCEKCYQELIIKNSKLQLEMKKRIPEEDVKIFMSKLRDLIIKPQTNKYNANDKLKDISELYLKHIDKLGGIKYESND